MTSPSRRHLHLDPVGGMAGDMFIAALLDAFPELALGAIEAAESLAPVSCTLLPHKDQTLAGARFVVHEHAARSLNFHDHDQHAGDHAASDHHAHVHWSAIRARIQASALPGPVKDHAIGIFSGLAEAEGRIHGIDPEQVASHEVGAADSIADLVAAATASS